MTEHAEEKEPSTAAPRVRPRARQIALAALFALAAVFALGAGLLAGLERPWAERRIAALVRGQTGFEVGWSALRLRLGSGLRLDGLTVRAPEGLGLRSARVDQLEVDWSPAALLGRGPYLDRISARGVVVELAPAGAAPGATAASGGAPAPPTSGLPAKLFAGRPPVGALEIDDASLDLPAQSNRLRISGLGLRVRAQGVPGGWRAEANLGSAEAPLDLAIEREGPAAAASARVRLWLSASASATAAALALDARVTSQTFEPSLRIERLIALDGTARFDPARGLTEIRLDQASGADGSLGATARLELPDDRARPLRLPSANGDVDLGKVSALLPTTLVPLRLERGRLRWRADGLELTSTGPAGALDLDGEVEGLAAHLGGRSLGARSGTLSLHLEPGARQTFTARGTATLAGVEIAAVRSASDRKSALASPAATALDSLALRLSASGDRAGPSAGELSLRFGRLDAPGATARDGQLTLRLRDLRLAPLQPLEARGSVEFEGRAGSVDLRDARLSLEGPSIELGVAREGSKPLGAELALPVNRVRLLGKNGKPLYDGPLRLDAKLSDLAPDLAQPIRSRGSARLQLALGELQSTLALTAADGVVDFTLASRLPTVAALAKLSPGIQLPPIAGGPLAIASKGRVEGLGSRDPSLRQRTEISIERLAYSGSPAATADEVGVVLRSTGGLHELSWLQGEGDATLRIAGLRVDDPRAHVEARSIALGAKLRRDDWQGVVQGTLALDSLHADAKGRTLDLEGLDDRLEARFEGAPANAVGSLTDRLRVHEIGQSAIPELPATGLEASLALSKDATGLVRIDRLSVDGAGCGTSLSLQGGLVLGQRRRKLSLHGELKQNLDQLSGSPDVLTGHGKVAVETRVESSDLETFRTNSIVRLSNASLELPLKKISAQGIDGAIPVALDLERSAGGVRVVSDAKPNPYSTFRFEDQHPLLRQSSFLSIRSLATPDVSLAPLAANLRVERNLVALSQLEVGVRGGRVTGQCLVDWSGNDTRVQARVRANGVLSSHGERFDGNAAVVVSLRERAIDGHAEIVRIGRRHLLDLLDLQDPHRSNAAFNRVRRALAFGYPDRVRLLFDHGFASALVTLGGLAQIVKIDELRGIPTEPIVDELVDSLQRRENP